MTATSAPRLDRVAVVRTAADLADRDGWAAVTLSGVAREVDRHVTSLYAHVDSLADLQRQVAMLAIDELTDEVWRAALGRVRGDALRAVAAVYRDFGTRHRGRVDAVAAASLDEEVAAHGRRLAEAVRAVFRSYGLDDERAAAAHGVFSATLHGLVRAGRSDRTLDDAVALFEAALSTGRWPA